MKNIVTYTLLKGDQYEVVVKDGWETSHCGLYFATLGEELKVSSIIANEKAPLYRVVHRNVHKHVFDYHDAETFKEMLDWISSKV